MVFVQNVEYFLYFKGYNFLVFFYFLQDREGFFIVVLLKDKRKRVFGLLGIDIMNDYYIKIIFIIYEIQFFQVIVFFM